MRAGPKNGALHAGEFACVLELAVPFVMEQVVAIDRRDEKVFLAVVVEVARGNAHPVHFDSSPLPAVTLVLGPILVVVVERA